MSHLARDIHFFLKETFKNEVCNSFSEGWPQKKAKYKDTENDHTIKLFMWLLRVI